MNHHHFNERDCMKYIVTKLPSGQEQIFVFDDDIMHVNFFEETK